MKVGSLNSFLKGHLEHINQDLTNSESAIILQKNHMLDPQKHMTDYLLK